MENKTFGRSIIVSATTKDDTKTISAEAANIPKDNTSQSSSSMAHLITLSGQQVVDKHELSVEQVLERCIEIDYETMENLTEDSEGCLNQWVEIFYAFPETWYMLMNDDEIVGYWHFVCLNDENFEKSKTGELLDGDVTIDTIEHMFLPGSY
ncbi:MAG: hypothetical protein LBC73_09030, partial [Oscillospiraceae bacterium]|nr:hypothetical protein [Oscillospiraceae bacterium]